MKTASSAKQAAVSLARGKDRRRTVAAALRYIEKDIDLTGKESILIKPNFVSSSIQLSATHVDAVEAVVEMLRERTSQPISVGENIGGSTSAAFTNFGYHRLVKKYGVRLINLDRDGYVSVEGVSRDLKPMELRVARMVMESDYRISVCPMKTHNEVVVTLSLKNVAVGSLESKSAFHQGYRAVNLSLYSLAKIIPPHLAVIDGFRAMEGNGPTGGTPVDAKVAIASTDFLAADCTASRFMGFDPEEIGYLHYCCKKGLGVGSMKDILLKGEDMQFSRAFQPHSSYRDQAGWRIPDEDRFL